MYFRGELALGHLTHPDHPDLLILVWPLQTTSMKIAYIGPLERRPLRSPSLITPTSSLLFILPLSELNECIEAPPVVARLFSASRATMCRTIRVLETQPRVGGPGDATGGV